MSEIEILQAIQDSEINFQINTFWDSGFTVRLGDEINGYKAELDFGKLEDGIDWLIKKTIEYYPNSIFAKNFKK